MAQQQKSTSKAEAIAEPKNIWWVTPSLIGSLLAGLVFAFLHVKFGGVPATHAGAIAVANAVIFLATYSVIKRVHPTSDESSLKAMLWSIVISIPVFVIAFIGLGKEISVMADFGAMYVLGVWIASAEVTERAQ